MYSVLHSTQNVKCYLSDSEKKKVIILGSARYNYIRSKLSPLTRPSGITRRAIFLPLCAAPPSTRSVEVSLPALFRLEQ